MSKKKRSNSWTVFTITAVICWIVFGTLFLTGCTLHFKGEKIELETKPPEAKIGQNQNDNATFHLAKIDLLKQK